MGIKDQNLRMNSIARRRESNEEVRARFEKEAHDRERASIMETVEIYDKFVERNRRGIYGGWDILN